MTVFVSHAWHHPIWELAARLRRKTYNEYHEHNRFTGRYELVTDAPRAVVEEQIFKEQPFSREDLERAFVVERE